MSFKDVEQQLDYFRYSRDEVHGYSKAVGKLLDLSVNYVPDAEKAYTEGKNAIWAGMGGWEIPLIYSNGIIPVMFSEMGRFAGVEAITIAEDYYQFPQETCSMVKCVVGEWHLRRNQSKSIKRVLVSAVACEPYNMAWEIIKKEGYELFNMDVIYRGPGVIGERLEQLVEFFVDQIYRVQDWLTGGQPVDEEKLKAEIAKKNRLLLKVRRILDLRLKHPFYIRSLPTIYLLNGLTTYFGKPEEFEETVNLLLEEMENISEETAQDKVIPLVWVGGTGQEFGVYEAIDQAGGALLGFRNVPFKLYREDIHPVEALARYVLDNQNAGASVYVQDLVEQEIEKVNAKGLILQGVLGCSYSTIAREMWREHFHQKGIPSINLEGTFQFGAPSGQLVTRTKAFIEMLS
ncbi:MAG: 2-hydroxyacyl-CoA dehydratase family protein [Syntrophomonadaceae bacterium]|jgi:benzoyl-CoA reductase/2-hydroxyglutaryl-CoA dehydratase subunit BcrC/BadD/HgdB|nr:2-hydroxyacyl-CoA dehydratase family protein [Syntrophomonadaceae bacterium]